MTDEELKRLVLLIHRRVEHLIRRDFPRDNPEVHPIDHEEISNLVAELEKDVGKKEVDVFELATKEFQDLFPAIAENPELRYSLVLKHKLLINLFQSYLEQFAIYKKRDKTDLELTTLAQTLIETATKYFIEINKDLSNENRKKLTEILQGRLKND